ncbi:hypothetical protein AUC68_11580 [Methyloceanibacter methanicus]|uniref:AsmA domain-containing protein n=1 Tax=Methyloceanibacter methanicus TaxID=1774968 RepID=A0A1E3VXX3_9HYPH|nr:AsmA family protein [Methyloceanibacter methanicus]ODR98121.1 hypothetical protein AUC68_11580 [Methyloceanibacter methanicus]
MNSLLLTLTALFILVLSALFAAPLFIDWNDYRPAIEAQMTKLIGRPVKVDGKVHLVVLPAPQLKFDDIKVANANGSLDTPFLKAKSLEAKLDVGTLLTGRVEAHELTIVDPTLRLRLDGAGGGNWSDLGPHKMGATFVPTDVLLDSVRVTGGTLELAKDGGPTFVFTNIDGEASSSSIAGPYKVDATYDFDGRPQSIRFSTGIIDDSGTFRVKTALRDPNRSSFYQLDGLISGLRAVPTYDGTFVLRMSKADTNQETTGADEPPQGDGAPAPDAAEQPNDTPPDAAADLPAEALPAEALADEEGGLRDLRETASFIEVKGPLKATPHGADLTDFELTLHASGRPQILKATSHWTSVRRSGRMRSWPPVGSISMPCSVCRRRKIGPRQRRSCASSPIGCLRKPRRWGRGHSPSTWNRPVSAAILPAVSISSSQVRMAVSPSKN